MSIAVQLTFKSKKKSEFFLKKRMKMDILLNSYESNDDGSLISDENLTISLKDYQKSGVSWMQKMEASGNKGGILADEMGLGKTVQMISLMASRKMTTLIVVPVILMDQWKEEINRILKEKVKILCFHSSSLTSSQKRKFEEDPKLFDEYDIVITTYASIGFQFKINEELKEYYNGDANIIRREHLGSLFRYKWGRVILDEAHVIKNRVGLRSVAVSFLTSEFRWCLSGTPIQNSSDDFYSLLRFLHIKPYCKWVNFKKHLSIVAKTDGDMKKIIESGGEDKRLLRLQTVIKCCMLRRLKNVLKTPLPTKTLEVIECKFDKGEREKYDWLSVKSNKRFEMLMKHLGRNYHYVLTMLLRMRQMCLNYLLVTGGEKIIEDYRRENDVEDLISSLSEGELTRLKNVVGEFRESVNDVCGICLGKCDHPMITRCGHIYCAECVLICVSMTGEDSCKCPYCRKTVFKDELIPVEDLDLSKTYEKVEKPQVVEVVESTKMKKVSEILKNTPKNDKTIVFCSFTTMFDILEKYIGEKGINYCRVDGSMDVNDRFDVISKFKSDPNISVMLLSLKAGNMGLNLTCANRVIFLDSWWNGSIEDQAVDRVHRIGQEKKVKVSRIVISNTIEQRILELQKVKKDLVNNAMCEGTGEKYTRLSRKQLEFLFKEIT